MKSYSVPSITQNGYFRFFILLFLISSIILLFKPSYAVSPENSNNRAGSQIQELNYMEGEITLAQVDFDGIKREFRYYVPKDFDKNRKSPLILVLHGYNQPIDTIISGYSSMHLKADKHGTVIIYPVSTGSMEENDLAWNTKYGSLGNSTQVDDIAYLSFLIDMFVEKMNCDPDRVYITGTSMGGAMTYALSCYIPEKITAIAPVIIQMGTALIEKFKNAKSMPVMIINGSQDPLVPEWGMRGDRFGVVPMVDNIHYWKNRNGISGTAEVSDLPDICEEITGKIPTPSKIRKYVWKGPDNNDMIWLNVINGGHWLPGYFDGQAVDPGTFELKMGTWNCDYDAAAAIYDFFIDN